MSMFWQMEKNYKNGMEQVDMVTKHNEIYLVTFK